MRYLSVFDNEGNLCTYEYGDTIDNVADRDVNATFTVPAASFVILTF